MAIGISEVATFLSGTATAIAPHAKSLSIQLERLAGVLGESEYQTVLQLERALSAPTGVDNAQAELAQAKRQLAASTKAEERLSARLAEANARTAKVRADCAAAKKELRAANQDLKRQLGRTQGQLKRAEDRIAKLQSQIVPSRAPGATSKRKSATEKPPRTKTTPRKRKQASLTRSEQTRAAGTLPAQTTGREQSQSHPASDLATFVSSVAVHTREGSPAMGDEAAVASAIEHLEADVPKLEQEFEAGGTQVLSRFFETVNEAMQDAPTRIARACIAVRAMEAVGGFQSLRDGTLWERHVGDRFALADSLRDFFGASKLTSSEVGRVAATLDIPVAARAARDVQISAIAKEIVLRANTR